MKAVVLTIAGSDSGAGAGIQADLKTFAALGVYGTSAITAVTAQNTVAVEAVEMLSPDIIYAQIKAIATDFRIAAAKTGMLGSAKVVEAVVRAIRDFQIPNLVVDTVMVSKSGYRLVEPEAESVIVNQLIPLARIITPNLPEAEVILRRQISGVADMQDAAAELRKLGCDCVFLKGGHLAGETASDIFFDGEAFSRLDAKRIPTQSTHGTGCTLSAAIVSYLAEGCTPHDACARAKEYLTQAISHAEPLGHGHGPVNHFWNTSS